MGWKYFLKVKSYEQNPNIFVNKEKPTHGSNANLKKSGDHATYLVLYLDTCSEV